LPLTRAEKADAQAVFRGEVPGKEPCQWCGGIHVRAIVLPKLPEALRPGEVHEARCPRIRRLEFHPNGNLVAVEFWKEWDESAVIWPEDAFDPEEAAGSG